MYFPDLKLFIILLLVLYIMFIIWDIIIFNVISIYFDITIMFSKGPCYI